ncbi:NADH dehydrogenase [Thiohalorhabdus denitrificans]|uniref:NADH-quinone oxidoreductase subunit F n=1 Tax=Thiohalorhabdus denitrificans TaxID=381306 RepID=A0A0P9CF86_9GAMM|nr:NADH-quinone oxidoreductase subunit NuoF [Thiohalorhabdus denitrificans]KPV41636.1 NADH dehydrogenase [Thiohalorhabdus denitrificans]SCY56750.1 NADH dehydrogenase subunit F [Thiohalorhabdus denitrificans]
MPEYPKDYTLVTLAGTDRADSNTLQAYLDNGGYTAVQKVLRGGMTRDDVVAEVKRSGLRGRGGAGFPTGLKWSFMPADTPQPKYLACNADEAEPGTFKDRDIMRYNPHMLIEGMIIGGFAIDATVGYVYIRGEFWEPYVRVQEAIDEAYEAGYLGKDILGSGVDFDLYVHRGGGAYIAGEETAMLESIEGKKAMPRFKPPFPANHGIYGRPTTVNNVETLASVPAIINNGGDWFQSLGTPDSGGTKIFAVSGHVNRPGNYEVPMGTPFSELLELAGGVRNGNKLKAVIPGGPSVPMVPGEVIMDANMDYESLGQAGTMLGAGSVIVMDETTCIVKAVERVAKFFFHESCGQCTPCREGAGWLYRVVHRIEHGQGRPEDLELLEDIGSRIEGRTICAFGDAEVAPVVSSLKHFRDEYEYHIANKRCMVGAAAPAGKVAEAG